MGETKPLSQGVKAENNDLSALFAPLPLKSRQLRNRVVMAPMTRGFSPDGVPGEDVAEYYRKRAAGGVGLIVTEGTWVPHHAASNDIMVPRFYGDEALAGWKKVVEGVHSEGGLIIPQLWHIGLAAKSDVSSIYDERSDMRSELVGPSSIGPDGSVRGHALTIKEIEDIQDAYVQAALSSEALGFDGVELHGAHGYLIDQFFWGRTNHRSDKYGGSIAARSTFAAEIIKEIRRRVSSNFIISFRCSQWKMEDYMARPWPTEEALEEFLSPLTDAGIDIYHCSQRRYWEPEFSGSNLNFAGWVKKLTGKPTITVGSVGLDTEFLDSVLNNAQSASKNISDLIRRLEAAEFDLVAIGRSLIANPDWSNIVRAGKINQLKVFNPEMLASLD